MLVYSILLPIVIQSDGWITTALWEVTRAVAVLTVVAALLRAMTPTPAHRVASGRRPQVAK